MFRADGGGRSPHSSSTSRSALTTRPGRGRARRTRGGDTAAPRHVQRAHRRVDAQTCSFPVARDFVFTNVATEFFDRGGQRTKLLLQQTTMGTLTANDTTLRLHIRETTIVEFEDGIPVRATHVGLLDFIGGRGGPVFHRTGQAVFEVVFDPDSGFYVDGPLVARHGLRADFDAAAFCASFA